MKVISGKYKGSILKGHNLEGTRPTMDRVKESLFAMLQFAIDEKIVLDLFAGSGNLGIEALSMKATKVFFVDHNKKAIECIKINLNNLNIKDKDYELINKDFIKALNLLEQGQERFDIIFLDPPYNTNYLKIAIDLITEKNLINKDGLIVCESDNLNKIPTNNNYTSLKSKKYGDKYIVILKKVI